MRFVITLTDEEFKTLSDRSKHLEETLMMPPLSNDIKIIIQRAADPDERKKTSLDEFRRVR